MAATLPDKPLLTLTEAARHLGVHTATLRRWADKGNIEVVITPGGHRRFPREAVQRLATHAKEGGALAEQWADHALSHTRSEIAEHRDERWMADLSEQERAEKREMGRRLMGLMMQYLAADDDDGEALLAEAQTIGRRYAEDIRKSGMPLTDALQATMFFRDNIVESAVMLPDAARQRPAANKRLLRRINTFLNTIQLAIADAYGDG